jgi:hypothetical protein
MEKTTRRNLLKVAAVGGVAAAGLGTMLGSERGVAAQSGRPEGNEEEHKHGDDEDEPLTGKRAQASVSFGQWDANADVPFDRQPLNSDRTRNVHKLLPFEVEVDQGGAVSFFISGVHQILVYFERTMEEVRAQYDATTPPPLILPPPGPPLVDIPTGRVYRGLDPRLLTYATLVTIPPSTTPTPLLVQDRVESVNFPKAGRYLVVCGLMPHFLESMHGYVEVRERD